MFKTIKEFFFGKPVSEPKVEEKVEAANSVPYKVEAPVTTPIPLVVAPAQCGCGRSPTGLCVGLHKLTVEEWATHADNTSKAVPVAKAASVAKAKPVAKPKAAAIKVPAKPKAPAKKPSSKKSK